VTDTSTPSPLGGASTTGAPDQIAADCRAAFLAERETVLAAGGVDRWRTLLVEAAVAHLVGLGLPLAEGQAMGWAEEPLARLEVDALGFRVVEALGAVGLLRQELASGRHHA
jgi:hypothetical protein